MWSVVITILAIAVASNLDNAGVGIAYGARGITISWAANLIIALMSSAATMAAGALGHTVAYYVNPDIAAYAAGTLMLLVGLWVLLEPWRRRRKTTDVARKSRNVVTRILDNPEEADFDRSKTISWKEAVVLGFALALNALAGGFDAGAVHIGVWETSLAVGVCSYILLGASAFVGHRYAARALGDNATYMAGILLIVIGVHQIW